jgi:hypothetical protein
VTGGPQISARSARRVVSFRSPDLSCKAGLARFGVTKLETLAFASLKAAETLAFEVPVRCIKGLRAVCARKPATCR